ncbi:MAG TPA: 2-oxo acid dehydrogenase subunit E2 [Gemmataceae bacterium]|nr:2-oxo acid dehydrogenase subunit E2 [Gemmataceae bacterium]
MAVFVDITLQDLQDGTDSVLQRWLRQPGEPIQIHEPLLEINTDKAVVEVPAPASGILRDIFKSVNDPVGPGDVLGRIEVAAGEEKSPDTKSTPSTSGSVNPTKAGTVGELSPAVRQLVKQNNLDASQIIGTGRGGRITVEDVQKLLQKKNPKSGEIPSRTKKVPHSPLRRRIAQHMVESALKTAPHVTAVFEADLSAMLKHRQENYEPFSKKGVKLTYTAYFVAAAVKALQAVPEVNSRWHDDALELMEDCNIGVATAVEGGLLVPVIARAQTLDLWGIATRLQDLTNKARTGKLEPMDLKNGTFTLTNHGVSGSLIATPIINQPQSAILGVGKLQKRPVVVVDNGVDALQIKPMAYVTLTIDHRALDGFQANRFLSKFTEVLASW